MIEIIKIINPSQVNIGANSKIQFKLPEPSKDKVLALICEIEKLGVKVHKKDTLVYLKG